MTMLRRLVGSNHIFLALASMIVAAGVVQAWSSVEAVDATCLAVQAAATLAIPVAVWNRSRKQKC